MPSDSLPQPPQLHHIPTNKPFQPRDSAVDLAGLGHYLALPKGMDIMRHVYFVGLRCLRTSETFNNITLTQV